MSTKTSTKDYRPKTSFPITMLVLKIAAQHVATPPAMKIRRALAGDLPAVGDVILEAMSVDPEWKPFFPLGARRDAEYVQFIETILIPGLDLTSQDILVTVAELPDEGGPGSGGPIVGAVAV